MDDNEKLKFLSALVNNNYRQLEALTNINKVLDLTFPLPALRGHAISPDFALILVEEILRHKPKFIVELGSGASTIIAGHCLNKMGYGFITSLDHREEVVEQTRQSAKDHSLIKHIKLFHAPLGDVKLTEGLWSWYDLEGIEIGHEIDFLIIDGPPGNIQKHARFPAMPILNEKLSAHCTIVIDDTSMLDNREIAIKWQEMFPDFKLQLLGTEKGTAVLRRHVDTDNNN